MRRLTLLCEEPDVSELLTTSAMTRVVAGNPHKSTLIRWALRGVLVPTDEGPARLLLPSKRQGQHFLFWLSAYEAWVAEQTRLHELARASTEPSKPVQYTRRRRNKAHVVAPTKVEPAILTRYGLNSEPKGQQ